MLYPGTLLSIEGLDGAGKSTVVDALAERLPEALVLREPGGTPISEFIRAVLKRLPLPVLDHSQTRLCGQAIPLILQLAQETESEELRQVAEHLQLGKPLPFAELSGSISAAEELLLFNAARAQLMHEVVCPALLEERTIILDRFIDSTVAYQGFGRGLDYEDVWAACMAATDGIVPNMTLYLRIDAATRLKRISGRGEPDRIERSGEEFFERVVRGFDRLAALHSSRFVVIDAEATADDVVAEAMRAIDSKLGS